MSFINLAQLIQGLSNQRQHLLKKPIINGITTMVAMTPKPGSIRLKEQQCSFPPSRAKPEGQFTKGVRGSNHHVGTV